MFDKLTQSNSRLIALDTVIVSVHYVAMRVGLGDEIKRKCRPFATMVQLKCSIVEVRAEENL